MTLCLVVEAVVLAVSAVDESVATALQSSGVLAHTTRRRVVSLLLDRGPVRREDLAAALAGDESVSQDDAARLEVALHHHHLPRLEEEQVVEYDHRNGDVALWTDPETAADLLESS